MSGRIIVVNVLGHIVRNTIVTYLRYMPTSTLFGLQERYTKQDLWNMKEKCEALKREMMEELLNSPSSVTGIFISWKFYHIVKVKSVCTGHSATVLSLEFRYTVTVIYVCISQTVSVYSLQFLSKISPPLLLISTENLKALPISCPFFFMVCLYIWVTFHSVNTNFSLQSSVLPSIK